eukprot:symbB.v1.2.007911.t1/scaffold494.1/size196131/5
MADGYPPYGMPIPWFIHWPKQCASIQCSHKCLRKSGSLAGILGFVARTSRLATKTYSSVIQCSTQRL